MANSRNKGKGYENQIAQIFKSIGFSNAKRHLEFQGAEAIDGRDLDGTQPFCVQAKCWKKTPSVSAIDQMLDSEEYPLRVAVLKRTQSKGVHGLEVAVLDLDAFTTMVRILKENNLLEEVVRQYYNGHL
jgi:hypothetical protein